MSYLRNKWPVFYSTDNKTTVDIHALLNPLAFESSITCEMSPFQKQQYKYLGYEVSINQSIKFYLYIPYSQITI